MLIFCSFGRLNSLNSLSFHKLHEITLQSLQCLHRLNVSSVPAVISLPKEEQNEWRDFKRASLLEELGLY